MSIIHNLPAEDYFDLKAASNSFLRDLRRSPAHAFHKEPEEHDTRAKEIGSAIHCALLEPDRFSSHYLVASADKRTDAEYRGLAKDVGGERVLTKPEHKRIIGMQNAAYRNARFARYMRLQHDTELTVTGIDKETGVPIKCRFDSKGAGLWGLDVKKTQDARGEEFTKAIGNYGYYMAIPFYAHVWEMETGERMNCSGDFPLIAIEEKAPHGVIVHDLDEVALILGRKHFREALITYARCLDSGVWPSYADDSEMTSVTSWFARELFEDGVE